MNKQLKITIIIINIAIKIHIKIILMPLMRFKFSKRKIKLQIVGKKKMVLGKPHGYEVYLCLPASSYQNNL